MLQQPKGMSTGNEIQSTKMPLTDITTKTATGTDTLSAFLCLPVFCLCCSILPHKSENDVGGLAGVVRV